MGVGDSPIGRESSGPNRGIREALDYVGKGWLPVNPETLERLRSRLNGSAAGFEPELFINELRADLGLLAHCVRSLPKVTQELEHSRDPISLLKNLERERWIQLLSIPEEQISAHRLDAMTEIQARSTRHAVISASTSHLLATKTEHDPNAVALAALLRQLGFLLVSWNYPRTYQKALSHLASSGGGDLEQLLFKYLGFSPTQLGMKLAVDWNKDPFLYVATGSQIPEHLADRELDPHRLEASQEMAHLCEIGEALARVNDPEHFASGKREWDQVSHDLTDYLGANALTVARDAILSSTGFYRSFAPKLFEINLENAQQSAAGHSLFGERLFNTSSLIKKCPPEIQDRLREVYHRIDEGQISIEGLNALVKEAVPACGFIRGCVYLADQEGQNLVPRLKIGDFDLSHYKILRSTGSKFSHPVVEALTCQVPIKQENVFMYGELVSHVTGIFGNRDKVGVLYLEMGGKLLNFDSHIPLLYFKVIREALNDCLNLRVA